LTKSKATNGTTLMLVSMGALNAAILEAVVRTLSFEHIMVATRDVDSAQARVNNALAGAGIEGRFPRVSVHYLDIHSPAAAETLATLAPDIVLTATTMLPWWRAEKFAAARGLQPGDIPFATWLPLHLAPMVAFRTAWRDSRLEGTWVGASYPDVINHVLAKTGVGPLLGVGNVAEIVPKIQRLVGRALDAHPGDVEVSLVAQHAVEYLAFGEADAQAMPPALVHATCGGEDVSALAMTALVAAQPLPYNNDFNRLTASATVVLLEALVGDSPVRIHVPAPHGRLGGYPALVSRHGVEIDLPDHWTGEQAESVNRRALPLDGIEQIDEEGGVTLTTTASDYATALAGHPVSTVTVENTAAIARDMLHA
jgi:hypothetical protein